MSKSKVAKVDKKKKPFFKFFKAVVKSFYKKPNFMGLQNIPEEPCIIVGNHAQLHGPVSMECYFPYKKYIWCIGNLMHIKEAPDYAFKDFWGYKPKHTHWFYKGLARLVSPLLVYLHTNADTIGVYKDNRVLSTFKNSVKGLKNGAHIILFPENHTPFNQIVNEFQTRFVDVAKLYFKDTSKELQFVPMYLAPNLKTIVYGNPIKYNGNKPIEEQRTNICNYLKTEITKMAKDLPTHTVIPYANIKKKQYPKSK